MPLLLWVDKERSVIVAMEGQSGFKTNWLYDRVDGKHYLPTEIRADMRDPRGSGEVGPTKVTIKFSKYRVNKGIDDKIFQEKNRSGGKHVEANTANGHRSRNRGRFLRRLGSGSRPGAQDDRADHH